MAGRHAKSRRTIDWRAKRIQYLNRWRFFTKPALKAKWKELTK